MAKQKKSEETLYDYEEAEEDVCVACGGTLISYWAEGIRGACLECCCIDCKKLIENCICTKKPFVASAKLREFLLLSFKKEFDSLEQKLKEAREVLDRIENLNPVYRRCFEPHPA